MLGQIRFVPSGCRDADAVAPVDEVGQHRQQRPSVFRNPVDNRADGGVDRHELFAVFLGKPLDQVGDLLFEQPRHQPFDAFGGNRRRHGRWNADGHAVLLLPGIEDIAQRDHRIAQGDLVRIPAELRGIGMIAAEVFRPHSEEGVAFPAFEKMPERPDIIDAAAQLLGVERGQVLFGDEDIAPPDPVLHTADLADQRLVVGDEGKRLPDVAFHQRAPDKNPGSLVRIDPAVGDRPPGHDDESEEAHLRVCDHLSPVFFPARIGVGIFA